MVTERNGFRVGDRVKFEEEYFKAINDDKKEKLIRDKVFTVTDFSDKYKNSVIIDVPKETSINGSFHTDWLEKVAKRKKEVNLQISDLKVGDKVRIKDTFFNKDTSDELQKIKGKIFKIVELQPADLDGTKLRECVRLDESDKHSKTRCWHVDWLELVEQSSIEKEFVDKIIDYLYPNAIKFKMFCLDCGFEFPFSSSLLNCPKCNSKQIYEKEEDKNGNTKGKR